ncbi:MAG: polyprenyl synthetase family protein [Brevinematia bacterium]
MSSLLAEYRKLISEEMASFFENKENHFKYTNQWGTDTIKKLRDFTLGGKMLRGSLLVLSAKMYSDEILKSAIQTAISMELFQSGFLIHDDIMDRDIFRRGNKTIFYQYTELFNKKKYAESYHLAESMGICAGDIAFFLGFENLCFAIKEETKLKNTLELFSRELSYVCLGQMDDIYLSALKENILEERILSIYLYKTARYTFSLPLMAGAILANAKTDEIKKLEIIGKNLGIIFQITDDWLGLYGSEEKIGKPVGSDIKENKKTLFYYYLFKNASAKDKSYLLKISGSKKVNQKIVNKVRDLIEKYGIKEIIKDRMEKLASMLKSQISELNVKENYKAELLNLLEYNLSRSQ